MLRYFIECYRYGWTVTLKILYWSIPTLLTKWGSNYHLLAMAPASPPNIQRIKGVPLNEIGAFRGLGIPLLLNL